MTTSATDELYYDPWRADLNADPYPMFKRIRDEAPLYYNEVHDFYALSRFEDVNRALVDNISFSSARGAVLEIIKSDLEIPSGLLVFEDSPIHDIHRNLLARAFTPRTINALEPMIREFTQRCLDPIVGSDRFDFVKDLGAVMPLRVVGMLFGIPEDHQRRVQEEGDRHVRTERGGQMTDNPGGALSDGQVFADFIDWRVDHPADDLTTELLNADSRTRPERSENCGGTNCSCS
jgi:cytochrome P450